MMITYFEKHVTYVLFPEATDIYRRLSGTTPYLAARTKNVLSRRDSGDRTFFNRPVRNVVPLSRRYGVIFQTVLKKHPLQM